jgi:hypothetical protein
VLHRLREWGVQRIYGYPGDGINGFLGALDRADGDPDFIQGAARGDVRADGVWACEIHRRRRRVPRHVRPGRDSSLERSLTTRSSTTRPLSRSSASRSGCRSAAPISKRWICTRSSRTYPLTSRSAPIPLRRVISSTVPCASPRPSARSPRSSSPTTCRKRTLSPHRRTSTGQSSPASAFRSAASSRPSPSSNAPPRFSTSASVSRCSSGRAPPGPRRR